MGLFSFAKDAIDFEKFHAGDLWDRIKKDPKRLVLGVDPASTKVWNAVLGRKDKPLVDQMGGAYGGHTFSAFGNKDGGVYQRAEAAGVPTGAGGNMQDAAHVIAAIMAGRGLSNIGGNSAPNTGSQESMHADTTGQVQNPMSQMQQQMPQMQQQQEQPAPPEYKPNTGNPAYQQTVVSAGAPITYTRGQMMGRMMRG
jgi:hypothetical protein